MISHFSFSHENPKLATYNFGHNGMELVARNCEGTVIISTFNSKMTIREDIARKIYDLYLNNQLNPNTRITIDGHEANVTGKLIIKKKKTLTVVNFYYETVEWDSGLTEVYKKNLG